KPDANAIKVLAKERGCTVRDLLALSLSADPFYADVPMKRERAEWFAALWERFGFAQGAHLRRVHYQLVSVAKPPRLPDSRRPYRKGTPYQNTEYCWSYLTESSAFARHLGLVPATALVDRRNPSPFLQISHGNAPPDPDCWLPEMLPWTLPTISLTPGT